MGGQESETTRTLTGAGAAGVVVSDAPVLLWWVRCCDAPGGCESAVVKLLMGLM